MIRREKYPRYPVQRSRNLDNLHVIPTSSSGNKLSKQNQNFVCPAQPSRKAKKKQKKYYQLKSCSNNYKKIMKIRKKNQKREARRRKRLYSIQAMGNNSFHWYNPNYFHNSLRYYKKYRKGKNFKKRSKVFKKDSNIPTEEGYFEEVETASFETEIPQEIPVGFRKSKIKYLKYKKILFFKPKMYNICKERTIVNCINAPYNNSNDAEIDVISEAEYEVDLQKKKKSEIEPSCKSNLGCDKTNIQFQDKSFVEMIQKSVKNKLNKVVTMVDDKKTEDIHKLNHTIALEKKSCPVESEIRLYKTFIEITPDLSQGKSLNQKDFDLWQSHLLGLEYLLEIQNKRGNSVLKYHCVLCSEDLVLGESSAICVINHINTYKHVVKYLESHFPSCGYRFAENSDYDNNFVILQKVCEEINKNAGYYFMCITNIDYFKKSYQIIQKQILNGAHITENFVNVNISSLEKTLETAILNEVKDVLNNVIDRMTSNKDYCKNAKANVFKETLNKKINAKNESCVSKKSNTVLSYLKLKAATTKLKNPPKKMQGGLKLSETISVKKIDNLNSFVTEDNTTQKNESSKLLSKIADSVENQRQRNNSKALSNKIAERKITSKALLDVVKPAEIEVTFKPVPEVTKPVVNRNILKGNPKALTAMKSTMHSKHCRKRILGKAISRLRGAAKTNFMEKQANNVSLNKTFKPTSVEKSVHSINSKNIMGIKKAVIKQNFRKAPDISSYKLKNPLRKVTPIQKANVIAEMLAIESNSKSYDTMNYEIEKEISIPQTAITIGNKLEQLPSNIGQSRSPLKRVARQHTRSPVRPAIKSPIRVISPISWKTHSGSPVGKHQRILVRKQSRSPVKRHIRSSVRKHVRSSVKRYSKSPLRKFSRSPHRRYSKSPVRRHSRSPFRRHSRSPFRRHSRSPFRRHSRSPFRRHSRSPIIKHSRSPVRRHSRSPNRRYSRSPHRRFSRSPFRRITRSPVRKHSKSPIRRHLRSPFRGHSRSPLRKYSRSPVTRYSRSPLSHSRSPVRRFSRSPIRRISRSFGRNSKSPLRHSSRSPLRNHSRSPFDSGLLMQYNDLHKGHSPTLRHSKIIEDNLDPHSRYLSINKKVHSFEKNLTMCSLKDKGTKAFKNLSPNKNNPVSYSFIPSSSRDADLDPVSDEDESVYFNITDKLTDNRTSLSANTFEKLLNKFTTGDGSHNDVSMNKFMQFIEAHSAEIQEMVGPELKSNKKSSAKSSLNVEGKNIKLQQYLLSNLGGNVQQTDTTNSQFTSGSNMTTPFIPPPFVPNRPPPSFSHMSRIPRQGHFDLAINQMKIFPPNLNVPPPERFHQPNQLNQELPPNPRVPQLEAFNQINQRLPPRPKVPPEVMFKDLKATVNKLFGANESLKIKEERKPNVPPGYVTEPDPEKWDLSHPNTPKFNVSPAPQAMFQSQEKQYHRIPGICEDDEIPIPFSSAPGQFFNIRGSVDQTRLPIPPPDAKVSFCDIPSQSSKGNLFPVINNQSQRSSNINSQSACGSINDVKVSLAQRLASVLIKVGMIDVPAPLLQEMLMKIGAFSSSPPQDIREAEIVSILKRLGYLS